MEPWAIPLLIHPIVSIFIYLGVRRIMEITTPVEGIQGEKVSNSIFAALSWPVLIPIAAVVYLCIALNRLATAGLPDAKERAKIRNRKKKLAAIRKKAEKELDQELSLLGDNLK